MSEFIASNVAFIGWLVHNCVNLEPLLQQHLDDNEGEVLPHLVTADIRRWAEKEAESDPASQNLAILLRFIEDGLSGKRPTVRDMLLVSFVEDLPYSNEPGHVLTTMIDSRWLAEVGRK